MKASAATFSPWPYAIIGCFAVFITGIVGFIIWAVGQDMELVRPDYYEHEILFQRQIDRQKRALELGADAAVSYDAAQRSVRVNIPAGQAASARGTIHFYRPSEAKLDHEVPLQPAADGSQQINLKGLRDGLWRIAVQWVADGQEYHLERSFVIGG
jgi:nitrogen fixation protein FixH